MDKEEAKHLRKLLEEDPEEFDRYTLSQIEFMISQIEDDTERDRWVSRLWRINQEIRNIKDPLERAQQRNNKVSQILLSILS